MFHPLENLDKFCVVLASGSPRRKELLGLLDLSFTVDSSHSVDEKVPQGMPARDVPGYLSRLKADAFPLSEADRRLVITADTVVILDGEVLGKPRDEEDAKAMLRRLSGRVQTVVTGVTVRTSERCETFSAESKVEFAELADAQIDSYMASCQPLDKAGPYGIQEWIGAAAIRGISGSFYNVMGLPIHRLYDVLKSF
ncbi:MAG: Maf family nucleotide pyrophosphatase [Duncaniella sp.]|nr:Maf family nucleotide pyrophosphatase [Duncaniella sp.]